MAILPTEPSGLASLVITGKLPEPVEASKRKIVLNDECGDSLWDEVLSQDNERLNTKGSVESEGLPNNDSTAQECDVRPALPFGRARKA